MDVEKEDTFADVSNQVNDNYYIVFSCNNCHFAIEVCEPEVELLNPCPCCECVNYKRC